MKKRRKIKGWLWWGILPISLLLVIIICDTLVKHTAKKREYTNINDICYNKVGLLLGTAKRVSNGQENLYFKYRIDAAVKLFNAKKIDYILVSGDNKVKSYNEPRDMMQSLIKRGIPENKIILDFAGFRTLDSVLRASKVFGQNKFTVISQRFHNERALFIAHHNGLDVMGFHAKSVPIKYGFKTHIREYLARVKAVLDIVLNKQAKFYGDPIFIGK